MNPRGTLLLITTSYPRWSNGREAAGSFVADLAALLAEHANVRVVAPGDRDEVEQVSSNLRVYRFAAPRRRLVNLRIWNPVDAWRILRTLRAGKVAVSRASADGRVDHMLALWALPSGWWAQQVGRKRGVPYSVWMLGSDVWALGRLPLVSTMLRRVMREAQHRYADGFQLARASNRICGLPVAFLPSTRVLEAREPPMPRTHPPYRLVFVGRWHRNKGIDLLLDALLMLGGSEWERIAEVSIHGGGPLHEVVSEKARRLLDARRPVTVGGFIPKNEAEQAIVRADYVIIPSRIESIPVVFSDAMKLGRPVIATPVGDLPDLFRRAECGILAEFASAPALCAALRASLNRSPREFDAGLRMHAADFEPGKVAANLWREIMVANRSQ